MTVVLGQLETQFFAFVQARERVSVETGELVNAFGWTPTQERKLLSRLARKGLVTRVRRGLYLIPPRLPPGGRWSPGEYQALAALMKDQDGTYQICGQNTFSRYGWTEQIPNRLYAYNNRLSGDRELGSARITLIKVADDRLGGTELVRTPDGLEVPYSSKARSLVDAVYDWSRFGSLPDAYEWVRRELQKDERLASALVENCLAFGNQGTIRRMGKTLDCEGVRETLLRKLEKGLRPTSSFIPWIPGRAKRGTIDKRWGVVVNDD
ncbi:MAG TPA: type IV toxin-antitoxin system AbiEi family antitoxin domain-containing protein [Gemmataceae bacterium]|jgi:predicted transcriptional regulator of viral defense system